MAKILKEKVRNGSNSKGKNSEWFSFRMANILNHKMWNIKNLEFLKVNELNEFKSARMRKVQIRVVDLSLF